MNLFPSRYTRIAAVLLASFILTGRAAEGDLAVAKEEKPLMVKEVKNYLPWEKGSIIFGGFLAAFDSDLGFGVNNAAGITINAEELFGLQSKLTVFRFDAMYRPGKSKRNQLDFTYASYNRSGDTTLSRDINIGDITIPVGAYVETVFDFDIMRLTYSYAILQDERMRIAVGLGVYAIPLKYSLSYETSGGKNSVEGADITLPLPAFALRCEFQLIPKLFLNTSVDFMYLKISDFQGSLLDVNIGLEYRPWKHFGLGLGYSALSVYVEAEASNSGYPGADFVGAVDVRYAGLMFYGKYSF